MRLVWILLLLSNMAWALAYRAQWYELAITDGLLSQAESYIHNQLEEHTTCETR